MFLLSKLEREPLPHNNLHSVSHLSFQNRTLKTCGQLFLPFKKFYVQFITMNPSIKNSNFLNKQSPTV